MCLQLIWSHSVASVNACLCLVRKMIIYDQSKTLPHTKYFLINLSRRASEIAALHLRNPNIPSPPPHSVVSSTSRRKYKVSVWQNEGFVNHDFLAHCSSYPYQSVCTLVWVCDDYNTPNQALPCSPVLVAAMLGGGRLQSSTSVGPLWYRCHDSTTQMTKGGKKPW